MLSFLQANNVEDRRQEPTKVGKVVKNVKKVALFAMPKSMVIAATYLLRRADLAALDWRNE